MYPSRGGNPQKHTEVLSASKFPYGNDDLMGGPLTRILQIPKSLLQDKRNWGPQTHEAVLEQAVLHWAAVGDGPATEPPPDGADANVRQVLEQDVLHLKNKRVSFIFAACQVH